MPAATDRRTSILTESARLFASRGTSATTVRQIADAVGILSGSLYHYFESKEAIADTILSGYLNDLRTSYRAVLERSDDPREAFRDLVQVSLDTAWQHPYATEIYQNDAKYLAELPRFGHLNSAAKEVQKLWLELITAGVDKGVFRSDIDPKVFYLLVRDALWTSVRWYKPTAEYPSARFAKDCTSVFLDGYAVRPGKG